MSSSACPWWSNKQCRATKEPCNREECGVVYWIKLLAEELIKDATHGLCTMVEEIEKEVKDGG